PGQIPGARREHGSARRGEARPLERWLRLARPAALPGAAADVQRLGGLSPVLRCADRAATGGRVPTAERVVPALRAVGNSGRHTTTPPDAGPRPVHARRARGPVSTNGAAAPPARVAPRRGPRAAAPHRPPPPRPDPAPRAPPHPSGPASGTAGGLNTPPPPPR